MTSNPVGRTSIPASGQKAPFGRSFDGFRFGPTSRQSQSQIGLRFRANNGLMHRSKLRLAFDHLVGAGSFGQPRFPKTLDQQLRACLAAPGESDRNIELPETTRWATGH
jgi:hypothetical protein